MSTAHHYHIFYIHLPRHQPAHSLHPLQIGTHVDEMSTTMAQHAKLQPTSGSSTAARQVFRGLMRNRELRDIAQQQVGARAGLRAGWSV